MNQPQDRYISVNGVKTHYWDEGSGDIPIVLVHGVNANVIFWRQNFSELAKSHRIIALDLIGFGRTAKPKINYSVEMLAQFVYDFLCELGINKCNLIGHSLGGAVCLQLSISFPAMINKLVLMSSAGFSQKVPLILRIGSLPLINKLTEYLPKQIFVNAIRYYVYDKNCITEDFLADASCVLQLPGIRWVFSNLLRQNVDIHGIREEIINEVKEQISKLTMPVLLIWGKNDKLIPAEHAQIALKLIPQAKLQLLDHCGHVPQMEYPDKFNQLVMDFLI